jgi:hypothetical protein
LDKGGAVPTERPGGPCLDQVAGAAPCPALLRDRPKERARRDAGIGSDVALLWSRRTGRAAVVVEEDASGDLVELDIAERENPLEVFHHPYAYMPLRGHPGRRVVQTEFAA